MTKTNSVRITKIYLLFLLWGQCLFDPQKDKELCYNTLDSVSDKFEENQLKSLKTTICQFEYLNDENKKQNQFDGKSGQKFMIYKQKMLTTDFPNSLNNQIFKKQQEIFGEGFKVSDQNNSFIDKNYFKREVFLISEVAIFVDQSNIGYFLYIQNISNIKDSTQITSTFYDNIYKPKNLIESLKFMVSSMMIFESESYKIKLDQIQIEDTSSQIFQFFEETPGQYQIRLNINPLNINQVAIKDQYQYHSKVIANFIAKLATKGLDKTQGNLIKIGGFGEHVDQEVQKLVDKLAEASEVGFFEKFFKWLFKVFSYSFKIYTIDRLISEQYSTGYHLFEILVGLELSKEYLKENNEKGKSDTQQAITQGEKQEHNDQNQTIETKQEEKQAQKSIDKGVENNKDQKKEIEVKSQNKEKPNQAKQQKNQENKKQKRRLLLLQKIREIKYQQNLLREKTKFLQQNNLNIFNQILQRDFINYLSLNLLIIIQQIPILLITQISQKYHPFHPCRQIKKKSILQIHHLRTNQKYPTYYGHEQMILNQHFHVHLNLLNHTIISFWDQREYHKLLELIQISSQPHPFILKNHYFYQDDISQPVFYKLSLFQHQRPFYQPLIFYINHYVFLIQLVFNIFLSHLINQKKDLIPMRFYMTRKHYQSLQDLSQYQLFLTILYHTQDYI